MAGGRWVVEPGTGKLIPAEEYYARKAAELHGTGAYVMPDIASFVSPVNFERITSRSQLREHEKRNGVRQCGELKTAQAFDNADRRLQAFDGQRFDQAFKTAIEKTGL